MNSIYHILLIIIISATSFSYGQVQFQVGEPMEADKKIKMNRMIGSDEDGFYTYRVSAKGNYARLIVEKYYKSNMKPMFSKEIKLNEEDLSVEEVRCVGNNVFVFISQINKKVKSTVLSLIKVSGNGKVDSAATKIISVPVDRVDYDVVSNPDQTKFLIKACYKIKDEGPWLTDFSLFNLNLKSIEWTKTVNQKLRNYKFTGYGLHKEEIALAGLFLDGQDNIFYGQFREEPGPEGSEKKYTLAIGIFKKDYERPKLINFDFQECRVKDIGFLKINSDQILVAGFIKGYKENDGKYFARAGIFSYRINLTNFNLDSRTIEYFDEKLMDELVYGLERSPYYTYKLDHIFFSNNAVYIVGQQYSEKFISSTVIYGASVNTFEYQYSNILVAKQGKNERIEWVKNIPFRRDMNQTRQEAFKQYVAAIGTNNIYIFNNENPENEELATKPGLKLNEFKSLGSMHNSNFICTIIDGVNGKTLKRMLVTRNLDYCFSPMKSRIGKLTPPTDNDIFTTENNHLYLYLEDGKTSYRFATIKFD